MTLLAYATTSTAPYDATLLVLRVVAGLTIGAHGYNHIFGGGKIKGTAGWFASMGMKPGILHAWLASVTELGSALLLVTGLLTPLAGAGLVGVMLVAGITAHRTNGFFIFKPGQGWEYVAVLGTVGAAMGGLGAGRYSLDNAFDIAITGWTAVAISTGGGLMGGALLLAAFWRPAPSQASS